MSIVLFYKKFNDHDLGDDKSSLRKKFNEIIKDLKENNSTSQGNIKLIKGDGNIEYSRAKLSDSDRLLFTSIKHNNKDAFVILEVILNHDYHKSKFLTNREKIKNIEIVDKNNEEVSDTLEIEDAPQVRRLGKFITFSAKQEDIVKNAEDLPLIVNGSAGSGKTSVALEKFRKIEEKFEEGKVLYITQSENLIKESKKLYEYYDDDFKIGIPDRIEFLSLHEFLEKRAEDIKGKKPINRSKFFSWFKEICKKDKFKKYKKDGDKIFEEFTAVIGGGDLLGEDGKDRYAKLGDRQSMFSVDERNRIYDFFKEYRKFIEKDSKYYDPNLVAYKCITEGMYDSIVVDEVQDLTESTLGLILRSLKDESKGKFLLCGDVNQVIHPSFFSLSKLKSFLHKNITDEELSVYTLEKNYRNSQQVIEFANRILHLKNYCFASEDKITVDNAFLMKSETKNKGNVGFIIDDKKEEIAKKINESVNCAVLVLDDESKEDARKLFDTPLVFNIHEAKGLEFENVILYKFTSCKAYNEIWKIACTDKSDGEIDNTINRIRDSYNEKEVNTSRNKDKKDKSLEKYKFYMNALYVGVTRAAVNLYIMDDKSNLLKIIEPREEGNVNIEQEKSSLEEWRNKALELIEKGNIEQAELIARKLQEGKKEYAEEVTNALRTNRYHEEDQILDKNKHTNAVLGIDISSRSSQSSEHEGDDISKLQNKKGKHNQNKKKKAKKCHQVQEVKPQLSLGDSTSQSKKPQNGGHKQDLNDKEKLKKLEKNTNELFFFLKNGNLQKAKRLIEREVNMNAKDERGLTPLHHVAKMNYKEVVEPLLKKGADVNAKDENGITPLHYAAEMNYKEVVELLIEKGANVNLKAAGKYENFTPLHFAAQNGAKEVVKFLLEKGAKVNTKSTGKFKEITPIHLAATFGCTDTMKCLLDHKADINDRDSYNCTPLHSAIRKGHVNMVKFLLSCGADINAGINKSFTPLCLAVQDIAKLSLKGLKTKKDATLLLEREKRRCEIVNLLLADPNINVACAGLDFVTIAEVDKRKFVVKRLQDDNLFKKVKEAAGEKDIGKLDELLKEIENLLQLGVLNKLCQTTFLAQLNFQSVRKENIKLRNS